MRIGSISSKELSRQLGTFAAHGIVERIERLPGNVSYELTAQGRDLMRPMQVLGEWVRSREAASCASAGRSGRASWLGPLCGAGRGAR
jgi:DNA-binding HxlR family transcriptional regulator